ncbi:hypothetical protein Clacol_006374 [Clathrus columnatus]|uniref:Oxidoreductase AflY n=1 Tax=Clathrus columnatus TaxID=1419009 RepID=A0AAV5AHG6_9AGAM|nr:hypothetical protein Clacol_006374 [Clathrus columnatus]
MSFSEEELNFLFPAPSRAAFTFPGTSAESAEALVRLLKQDFVNFHCFFNEKRFHNHLSHHLYAAYALGATPEILQEAYDYHASYQIKAYSSPASISIDNWRDHLGDPDYYNAYLKFFANELRNNGSQSTLEKFIFSSDANFGEKHPEMVSRLFGGLLHPFIYVGYGIEFGHLGLVAEGLAQAAVHLVSTSKLITKEFLDTSGPKSLATRLEQKLTLHPNGTVPNVHPLSILDRVLKDKRLEPEIPSTDLERYFNDCIEKVGPILSEYALTWQADVTTSTATANSIEEVIWAVSAIYGIGGLRKDKPFKADFFTMHFVTSSLFISPVLELISQDSKRILLQSYFALLLGYWVSQGRTKLDVETFYSTTINLTPPGPKPTPHEETLAKENLYPNLWYPIAQSVIMHPGEHVLKLVRAFARFAVLYGTTPKGHFKHVELKGAEFIDGGLFVKASFLSLGRNGWMREGGDKAFWDFDGFFGEN